MVYFAPAPAPAAPLAPAPVAAAPAEPDVPAVGAAAAARPWQPEGSGLRDDVVAAKRTAESFLEALRAKKLKGANAILAIDACMILLPRRGKELSRATLGNLNLGVDSSLSV